MIIIIGFKCDEILDYIDYFYYRNQNKKIHIYAYVNTFVTKLQNYICKYIFLFGSGEYSFYIPILLKQSFFNIYINIYIKLRYH